MEFEGVTLEGIKTPTPPFVCAAGNSIFAKDAYYAQLAGWGNRTIRHRLWNSKLSQNGSKMRFRFQAPPASDSGFDECWVGHASGNYGFDGNQVQLFFREGDAGLYLKATEQVWSDAVVFDLDSSKDLVISNYISGSQPGNIMSGLTDFMNTYYANGVNQASYQNPVGYQAYSGGNRIRQLSGICISS